MKKTPNILITFMDDQRADAMSCAGHPVLKTPALDRLAQEGTRYTGACNAGADFGAVCAPSRAMLHTGRGFWRINGNGIDIPREWPTLGERLRQQGYHTHGVGKWHNDTAAYTRSFCSGGEIFFNGMGDPWFLPLCHFDASGGYDCVVPMCKNPYTGSVTVPQRCDHVEPGRHASELFADEAVRFLETYDGEEPFMLYVAFTAPHDPCMAPRRWHEAYTPEETPPPVNWRTQHPFDLGIGDIRDELLEPLPRDEAHLRRHMADYCAMMAHADEQIGRIHEALRRRADADDTVVAHSGDHGLALGAHGLMGKQNLYQHSLRIPLIMAGPGLPRGTEDKRLCYGMDLHRTLLDVAGIEAGDDLDSQSLLENDRRAELHFRYRDRQRAWTDGRWKLIETTTDGLRRQLFDLDNDPLELKDLAGESERRPLLDECLSRLDAGWTDTHLFLKPDPIGS